MKISLERVIIIALLVAFAAWYLRGCNGDGGNGPANVEKETTVTETVDIKKTIDEAVNNALGRQTPETRPYIIYPDNRVVEVKNIADVNKDDLSKVKDLQVYRDTTDLKNAKVFTEIVADGKVYSNKVTAEVEEKTITKTITEKTTVNGSGLFVSGGAYVNPDMKLNTIEAGLNYIYKNDVGAGASVIYDTGTKQPYYGFKIFKKIF